PVPLNEWQKVQVSRGVPQCLPRTYLHIQSGLIHNLIHRFFWPSCNPPKFCVSEYDARIMEMTHLQLDSLTQKGNTPVLGV
ncbi:mCG1028719, partial [Mus musculus]